MNENSKRARVISAFPGMGKSYLFDNCTELNILDSDSSKFSWIIEDGEKKRNPEFPQNYIEHIKENLYTTDIILVSTHKEVRDLLVDNKIYFELCYPSIEDKEIYKERYIRRGSPEAFINLIDTNWETWISELEDMSDMDCVTIQFEGDTYLTEFIEESMKLL